jgi:hypothetical protein
MLFEYSLNDALECLAIIQPFTSAKFQLVAVGNTGLSPLWKVLKWELTIYRHSICQQRHPIRSINTAVDSSVSIIKSFNPSPISTVASLNVLSM